MSLHREEEGVLLQRTSWKQATALIGPRRAGKSTLAARLLDAWLEKGGEGERIDLEEPGAPQTMEALLSAVERVPKGGLVVLDEVQVVPGWVKVVRSQVEYEKRHVIVTGSSASLLSGEIASSLGGRAMPFHVLPLSYRNANEWREQTLEEYLKTGGFPECVLNPNRAEQEHTLYLESTVLKDVASRLNTSRYKELFGYARLLLSEPGKMLETKKTAARVGVARPTLREFEKALQDAFLVMSVQPWRASPGQRLFADAKHYAYDVGFQRSLSVSATPDEGRRLENLAAIELVRRGYALTYWQSPDGTSECDFIATKAGAPNLAIQVTQDAAGNQERELRGLIGGMKASEWLAHTQGLLLTRKTESPLELPKNATQKTIEDWLREPYTP